jgi:antitoxin VapB
VPGHRVKLFRNGQDQAVRVPRELELPGDDAIIRREADRNIIEPSPPRSLLMVLSALEPIDECLPPIAEPRLDPVDV